jgi:hypothetical protein
MSQAVTFMDLRVVIRITKPSVIFDPGDLSGKDDDKIEKTQVATILLVICTQLARLNLSITMDCFCLTGPERGHPYPCPGPRPDERTGSEAPEIDIAAPGATVQQSFGLVACWDPAVRDRPMKLL